MITVDSHIKNIGVFLTGSQATVTEQMYKNGLRESALQFESVRRKILFSPCQWRSCHDGQWNSTVLIMLFRGPNRKSDEVSAGTGSVGD